MAPYSVLGTKTKYKVCLNEFEKSKKSNMYNMLQNYTWSKYNFYYEQKCSVEESNKSPRGPTKELHRGDADLGF